MSSFTLCTSLPALLVTNSRCSTLTHHLVRPLLIYNRVKANHLINQDPPFKPMSNTYTSTKRKRHLTYFDTNALFPARRSPLVVFNVFVMIPAACVFEKGPASVQRMILTAMETNGFGRLWLRPDVVRMARVMSTSVAMTALDELTRLLGLHESQATAQSRRPAIAR